MTSIFSIFESAHVIALLTSLLIFFVTIFLVIQRWIDFSTTLLLLLFSLLAGILINNQNLMESGWGERDHVDTVKNRQLQLNEQKELTLAIENLQREWEAEKQTILSIQNQVQHLSETVYGQQQQFEEWKEQVKKEPQQNEQEVEKNFLLYD
jgi:hypothetical protein